MMVTKIRVIVVEVGTRDEILYILKVKIIGHAERSDIGMKRKKKSR